MSISDTLKAKKYASIAEVAAAQAKLYALELENAPEYAAEAKASAQQAEAAAVSSSEAQAATVGYAVAAANSATQAGQYAQESAEAAQQIVDDSFGTTVRVPSGESLSELPAASLRIDSVLVTDNVGDVNVKSLTEFAMLDVDGKVPLSMIPAAAITEVFPVSSQAAMLALSADPGDVAKRTDQGLSYILMQSPPSILGNWVVITDDVLAQLALSSAAGEIGALDKNGVSTTVQEVLDSINTEVLDVQNKIGDDISKNTSIITSETFSEIQSLADVDHYTVGNSIPKDPLLPYDHFGITMKMRDGRVITLFRRAQTHVGTRGVIMKTELMPTGWSAPTQVLSDPTLDMRCASGGLMPNGNIVLCTNLMQTDNTPRDVVFYLSKDCGETWSLIKTVSVSQSSGYSYVIPYGQSDMLAGKIIIPFYKRVGAVFSVSYFTSSDDGYTWSEGNAIYSGVNDYNETQIANIGKYAIAISRIGSGVGTKFHIFYSSDAGSTWSDIGDSNFTGGDGAYVVAPSLFVRRTKNGVPYILFLYVDRTAQALFYRYSTISKIVSADYTFSERYRITGGLPNSSGYQSGYFEGNRLLGVVWKETAEQTASEGNSFELTSPEIPSYDSGWVSVSALQNYTLSTGFNQKIKSIDVYFSPDSSAGTVHKVSTGQVSTNGAGAAVALTDTQIVLRTGTYPYSNSLFGSSGGTNYTTGYYRVYGWL